MRATRLRPRQQQRRRTCKQRKLTQSTFFRKYTTLTGPRNPPSNVPIASALTRVRVAYLLGAVHADKADKPVGTDGGDEKLNTKKINADANIKVERVMSMACALAVFEVGLPSSSTPIIKKQNALFLAQSVCLTFSLLQK